MGYPNPFSFPSEYQPEKKYSLRETLGDFYHFALGYRKDSEISVCNIVPEGYSSRRTLKGFIKFLMGERDPKELYIPLRRSNQ